MRNRIHGVLLIAVSLAVVTSCRNDEIVGSNDIVRANVSNPVLFVDSVNKLSIQLSLTTPNGKLSTQYMNNERIITILTFENLDSVNSFYTHYKYIKPNNSLQYYHDSVNDYLLTGKDIESRKWIANGPGDDGTYPTIDEPEPDEMFEIGPMKKLRYVLVSDTISNKAGQYNIKFETSPIPSWKPYWIETDTMVLVVPDTLKIDFILE